MKKEGKEGEKRDSENFILTGKRRNAGLVGVKSVGIFSDVHSRTEKREKL
jgi:hypothetical protein